MKLNTKEVVEKLCKFLAFVHAEDKKRKFSFVDKNTFLGRNEGYKAETAELARNVLKYDEWQDSMIGSGEITLRCKNAMACSGNLVYINQQYTFDNITSKGHKDYSPDAERTLYDIYRGENEKAAFEQALKVFGKHYDMIAYLFFVKDSSRFLPVRPGSFQNSLASIGVKYKLSHMCSWENYTGFIAIVREVQKIMKDIIPDVDVRLIDAHSFLWIINLEGFRSWEKSANGSCDAETSAATRRDRTASYFVRSADVAETAKARAGGVCQLCGKPAPFKSKNGLPYLETHHIVWLSRGGMDSLDNTAALCPNCHAKMHILDDESDIKKLFRRINAS